MIGAPAAANAACCASMWWNGVSRSGWCVPASCRLHVDPQRVVMLFQQAADGRRAGRITRWRQPMTQLAQTTADPLPLAHRVTRRCRRDQVQECSGHQRVFFSARGRPAPGPRTRSVGRSVSDTASSCRPRLIVCGSSPVICATNGSPRGLDGSPRWRHTTAVAVHPDGTATRACDDVALDRDGVLPAGHVDIGICGPRDSASHAPRCQRIEKSPYPTPRP